MSQTSEYQYRPRRHALPLLALIAALAACATDTGGRDIYRSDDDYVRLEPIERNAPLNAHPVAVSADALRRLLRSVQVSRASTIDNVLLFSPAELNTLVTPLAAALAAARPDEDVTFAVSDRRGMFGKLAPKTITTGRVFARDGDLNVIFGRVHARTDERSLDYSETALPIIPGTRRQRIESVWKIAPGTASFHDRRGDWLVFRAAAAPAPAAQEAPREATGQPPPADDDKVRDIENRLRTLDTLRERGAITEEEYRERRRAILDRL